MVKSKMINFMIWLFGFISITSLLVVGINKPSYALSGSEFEAGRIIDDAVFFNKNALNVYNIQNFLNSKVPTCDTWGTQPYGGTTRAAYGAANGNPAPYTCLKGYSQAVPFRAADQYCSKPVNASASSSAAGIIYDVAQACGVNPAVLIVLLQKEQSLVTDDWPWQIQYNKATGFACPDTAPCNPEFGGFFDQVYYAARQFQRYVIQSNLFNYQAGATNNILYHPNSACGTKSVFINNQATAGLYNYTPYTPNNAALNNLYGTGDACSSYGNRNFWRLFSDWFGSTRTTTPYAWAYESQSAFTDSNYTQEFTSRATVEPNDVLYVRVRARNVGYQTWYQTNTKIGTSKPIDRTSQFQDASWLNYARPARLKESSVVPGAIGTFELTLNAPTTPGTFKEYYNVLIEGITWLNDPGLFFEINVNSSSSPIGDNYTLNEADVLIGNDYLLSQDRKSILELTRNGSLSLKTNFGTKWSTPAAGSGSRLVMQTDGNLVLYDKNNTPVWNTETSGNPGARLVLQTDGNLVVYKDSTVLWATYTIHRPNLLSYINTSVNSKGILRQGQEISTANRNVKLVLQTDGNLVLYRNTTALWATGTDGKDGQYLAMQPDGNLVLYNSTWQPIWFSRTNGYGRLRLTVQTDGNLVLYDYLGRPFWHTGTYQ